jgi:predicted amidophosphoribosyltransferase
MPPQCPGCGEAGRGPCARCWTALTGAPVRRCVAGLDSLVSCGIYEGPTAELVAAFKFRGAHVLSGPLGSALATLVDQPVDVVCWIPATATHRRRRGYDQGALLAKAVATELGLPKKRLLRRGRGRPQLGATRQERLRGPALSARGTPPSSVLVVDDVVTTGASFAAAATSLRLAGAGRVSGVAVATTRL